MGRIDELADSTGILKVGGELLAVALPGIQHYRIFYSPFFFQLLEIRFCFIFAHCLVNGLLIDHESLLILAGYILERVADLMQHTGLDLSVRVNASDSFGKAFEVIDAGDQDIGNAQLLEAGEHP